MGSIDYLDYRKKITRAMFHSVVAGQKNDFFSPQKPKMFAERMCTISQGSTNKIWWEKRTRQKLFPPPQNKPFN
jgi:hypothetical protein